MDIRNTQFAPMSSGEWIEYISNTELTEEDLCWIYCFGMEWCGLLTDPENLLDVTQAMLERGMNPNQLVTEELPDEDPEKNSYLTPLISSTRYQNDQASVKSFNLLLEHGGNPNTMHDFWGPGENIFDFYIWEEYLNAPDLDQVTFYGLLLCAAYGGKRVNGAQPFTMLTDEPLSVFKDYDRYWFEYDKDEPLGRTFYVVEKETGRRVARYL